MGNAFAARINSVMALYAVSGDAGVVKRCTRETVGVMACVTFEGSLDMTRAFSSRNNAVVTV